MQINYIIVAKNVIDWNWWWLVVKMTKHSCKWHLIAYSCKLDSCLIQDFFSAIGSTSQLGFKFGYVGFRVMVHHRSDIEL